MEKQRMREKKMEKSETNRVVLEDTQIHLKHTRGDTHTHTDTSTQT